MTIQYPIQKKPLIAYLNPGEQVVRGPVTGATVYRVVLFGPNGYSYRLKNGSAKELPPAAPYNAPVGSTKLNEWENQIDKWLSSHRK